MFKSIQLSILIILLLFCSIVSVESKGYQCRTFTFDYKSGGVSLSDYGWNSAIMHDLSSLLCDTLLGIDSIVIVAGNSPSQYFSHSSELAILRARQIEASIHRDCPRSLDIPTVVSENSNYGKFLNKVYCNVYLRSKSVSLAQQSDQVNIYFKQGESTILDTYKGNGSSLESIKTGLRSILSNSHNTIDSIVISASSSPEGRLPFNKALADDRGSSLERYIIGELVDSLHKKVIVRSFGEDWGGLQAAVFDDPNVPNREAVLDILNVSSNRDARQFFLSQLDGGRSWRYLNSHIFPNLRSSAAVLVYYTDTSVDIGGISPLIYSAKSEPISRDTLRLPVTRVLVPLSLPIISTDRIISSYTRSNRPVWAIKTNLVYWAALQGNVEFEFYMADRWSLNFEYQVAWWKNDSKHQYYQYTQCGPEGRYWFKADNQFRGHYIGLHVGFGIYDLSWGHQHQQYQGYQGEFAIALGISYGYVWRLGEYLNLEVGFGFGYIMTEYRRYRYIDDCSVYQATERMQFLGPTKARVNLVWQLGRSKAKKR